MLFPQSSLDLSAFLIAKRLPTYSPISWLKFERSYTTEARDILEGFLFHFKKLSAECFNIVCLFFKCES
ncbi:hypothetical protein ACJIZ3_022826 [Penstemon smallii]|uniref:Uncharacterized protein n=1 Tax=Penstemon smallii TaxID=265156 RepID=A0ABD3TMG9_9LAMI